MAAGVGVLLGNGGRAKVTVSVFLSPMTAVWVKKAEPKSSDDALPFQLCEVVKLLPSAVRV